MLEKVSINPNICDKYTWDLPRQPTPTVNVNTYADVKQVLTEPHFASNYNNRLLTVTRSALAVSYLLPNYPSALY
jgi:hypothetical protein